jgi:hypothetical protein
VEESKLNKVIDVWGKVHDTMLVHLSQTLGEEQLRQLLKQPLQELGEQSAERGQPDARTIGRAITEFENNWNIEGRILEDSPNRFVREVTYCPWSYFHPLSCRVLGWYMQGFCRGVNPRCNYELKKLMPDGDDVCLWIVSCAKERGKQL